MQSASFLALMANLFFAGSTISYGDYSKRYGSLWVNSFKSILSLVVMGFVFVASGYVGNGFDNVTLIFMLSGLIGLAIGDILLVIGFQTIGPARTLLLFGVQPVMFIFVDLYWVPEKMSYWVPIGVLMMMASLGFIFFERKKNSYEWSIYDFACGLSGVLLDFSGVLITKWGMNNGSHDVVEVYFWRMLGASIGLLLIHMVWRKPLLTFRFSETGKQKAWFMMACVMGTVASLWCYLKAIEIGPLSAVAAVAVTGPLFAGLFEWLFYKKPLTTNLALSICFFSVGFYILS